VPRRPSA